MDGRQAKQVTGMKMYKLPVTKISQGDEKYNIGNILNNTVIMLYGDTQ